MLNLLRNYPNLIVATLKYHHRFDGQIEQFKAVVQLIDGSTLHINEVWLNNTLHKYAYYRLDGLNEVIQGWDNAPHHPEISTHPHHVHIGTQVEASTLQQLRDVLNLLKQQLVASSV